jgi:hypothetical protein
MQHNTIATLTHTHKQVLEAMREFVHCHCKFLEKTYVCLFTRKKVWELYCKHHDKGGKYFIDGSPAWLAREIENLQAEVDGDDDHVPNEPERPISLDFWYKRWQQEKWATTEKWRSCCCQLCAEVEDLLGTWGAIMSVVHGPDVDKSETGRQVRARCRDQSCRWHLPTTNPAHLRLPKPFPMRFQQQIASGFAQIGCPSCPSLFCGKVGEGGADEETGLPKWLYCREAECNECGFAVRFPQCPTIATLSAVTCRVLSSRRDYVKWLGQDESKRGGCPAKQKMGETEQLVEVKLSGATFLRYVAERMNEWYALFPTLAFLS